MEELYVNKVLKKEIESLELIIKNLKHEMRNTYIFACDSVWNCENCLEIDGVERSLVAEYDYGENSRVISRWMECEKCGWNDKQPGIIKKYVYDSKFLKRQ